MVIDLPYFEAFKNYSKLKFRWEKAIAHRIQEQLSTKEFHGYEHSETHTVQYHPIQSGSHEICVSPLNPEKVHTQWSSIHFDSMLLVQDVPLFSLKGYQHHLCVCVCVRICVWVCV